MGIRLTGINPLAYMGVEPYTPPALLIQDSPPTANDFQNVNVGTFWLIMIPQQLYYLASVGGGAATWIQLYPAGSGGAAEFPCNVGTANEAAGILNILGDGVAIQTSGTGNTVTISILGEVATSFHADSGTATPAGGVIIMAGGLNINTFASGESVAFNLNDNVIIPGTLQVSGNTTLDSNLTISSLGTGVVQTNSSGLVSSSTGTNGQVLIGGGTHPQWANITSTGGTVIITNGANSINLESTGGGGGGGGTLSFYAYQVADYKVTPAPTPGYSRVAYPLGSGSVLTTIYNAGGAFYPGDGVSTPASFTAPVRGRYFFAMSSSILTGVSGMVAQITQDSYSVIAAPTFNYVGYSGQPRASTVVASWQECVAICEATVELNVNDQVTFQIYGPSVVAGGSPPTNYAYQVVGDSPETVYPYDTIGMTRNLYPTNVKGWLLEEF